MPQFNKMFVMLPVMLLARKLDVEDPKIVNWIRLGYALMQTLCILVVLYTYWQARKISGNNRVVYVPPAPTPFADPNAKKKYTETIYGTHVASTARSLVASTLFGVAFTVGLHYYKGMVMGLAIQTIMGPFNLAENPLVRAFVWNSATSSDSNNDDNNDSTQQQSKRWFDEKTLEELDPTDEIVDEAGNTVDRQRFANGSSSNSSSNNNRMTSKNKVKSVKTSNGDKDNVNPSLPDLLLDTWDAGASANIDALVKVLNKQNCDTATADDSWTPLMILSGLGAPGTAHAVKKVLLMGANPCQTDVEGWNAAHWAAFHNNLEAANVLVSMASKVNSGDNTGVTSYSVDDLLKAADKEGLTPFETAKKEGNDNVAAVYEKATGESKKSK